MTSTPPHRSLRWLHLYGRRYPHAWEFYAQLQANPPGGAWPQWCWMPLAGAYAVISEGGTCSPAQAADIGPLGGLAAWRATQGIYRVHPALLEELLATPIDGDLPAHVLTRLPEWCVYVETPGHIVGSTPLHGLFAYLEHDINSGRAELRMVLDLDGALEAGIPAQLVVHLSGSLEDGIRAAIREARVQALRTGAEALAPSAKNLDDAVLQQLGGLVSILLYLCADDAEIDELHAPPPKVVHGKKRPILPAAKAPAFHPCGYRIGAALEQARSHSHQGLSGEGRSVAPHVRRAHWHRYWTGPRDADRRLSLRWLNPILVGMDDEPQSATLRQVNRRDESD